jgi:hypothetical protein
MRAWLPPVLALPFVLTACPALLSDWSVAGSGSGDAGGSDATVSGSGSDSGSDSGGSSSSGSGSSSGGQDGGPAVCVFDNSASTLGGCTFGP